MDLGYGGTRRALHKLSPKSLLRFYQRQSLARSCSPQGLGVPCRDCTGRPFLGFLGFGLFGKITRVLGRVFGLLLVREKELICEKAYIFISHFKAYDCYTSKSYFFFIFDRKWDLSKNKSSVVWSLSRVRSLVRVKATQHRRVTKDVVSRPFAHTLCATESKMTMHCQLSSKKSPKSPKSPNSPKSLRSP